LSPANSTVPCPHHTAIRRGLLRLTFGWTRAHVLGFAAGTVL
jgi:hypothetical protein